MKHKSACLPLWLSLIALCVVAACLAQEAQSPAFRALHITANAGAPLGKYTLRLAEPDDPEKPTQWQGPLTIAKAGITCTADLSLVSGVYAAPAEPYVVAVSASGSSTFIHFIDLDTCAARWPPLKQFTTAVHFTPGQMQVSSNCESSGPQRPASCTSAHVFRISENMPPVLLRDESRALTRRELGVAFVGRARVSAPRTSHARLVH